MSALEKLYLQDTYLKNMYDEFNQFKNKLMDIEHDKTTFLFQKEETVEDLNEMINYSFINVNAKIKKDIYSLIKILNLKYDIDNILCYKDVLEIVEIYSKTISNDLWIQYLITRDENIHTYRSKINYINFSVKDNLGNITMLYVNYEKIIDYYEKIKMNGNLKFLNFDISKIDYIIKNIDELETHFSKIKEYIESSIYYLEREDETIKIWKSLQDEFFEIAYHPSMFKKIVLDEKEVSIYT